MKLRGPDLDQLGLAMTLIGALMKRLGVEQADFGEKELNEVQGSVAVEMVPGRPFVRIDLRPDATGVD